MTVKEIKNIIEGQPDDAVLYVVDETGADWVDREVDYVTVCGEFTPKRVLIKLVGLGEREKE